MINFIWQMKISFNCVKVPLHPFRTSSQALQNYKRLAPKLLHRLTGLVYCALRDDVRLVAAATRLWAPAVTTFDSDNLIKIVFNKELYCFVHWPRTRVYPATGSNVSIVY